MGAALTIATMAMAFVAPATVFTGINRVRNALSRPAHAATIFWAVDHLLANCDSGGFLVWDVFDAVLNDARRL